MKPEDKQKISSFLYSNKTSKDVKKAESDKIFNPHLAVCSADNPPANNRPRPIILKTKDVTKSVSYGYSDEQIKMAFKLFLQDSDMVDALYDQFVTDAESYNQLVQILNERHYFDNLDVFATGNENNVNYEHQVNSPETTKNILARFLNPNK